MSAIAALKGYRTQFLYSLHRIVFGVTDDYVYHIEGEFEDLDIIDNNGKYVECLQVKNLSDSLTFSDLFSAKDSQYGFTVFIVLEHLSKAGNVFKFYKF